MIKFFKIIEKGVWTLVAIAVIMLLALIAISVANSADNFWDDVRPYTSLLYGVAMLVVAFKAVILGVQMYLETKIEEKTKHLQIIIEKQQSQQLKQEKKVSGKLGNISQNSKILSSCKFLQMRERSKNLILLTEYYIFGNLEFTD